MCVCLCITHTHIHTVSCKLSLSHKCWYYQYLILSGLKYILLDIDTIMLHWHQQWKSDFWGLLHGLFFYFYLGNFIVEIVVKCKKPIQTLTVFEHFPLQLVCLTAFCWVVFESQKTVYQSSKEEKLLEGSLLTAALKRKLNCGTVKQK